MDTHLELVIVCLLKKVLSWRLSVLKTYNKEAFMFFTANLKLTTAN